MATAQASANRWRCPPDMVETTWSACSSRFTRDNRTCSGIACARAVEAMPSRANRMFCRAVA